MSKNICVECGNTSGNWIYFDTEREYKGDGYCFTLDVKLPYCEKCNAPIYDKLIEEEIRERANNKIREQLSIITQKEIEDLLDQYKVSQKFLSKVLGWGEITLPRYLKGRYTPNRENSDKLKSIKNPYVLLNLLKQNITEEDDNLCEKLLNNINIQLTKLEDEKGKLFKVVDWFLSNISEEDGITNLSLQKALYFTQAWGYIFNQKWIFPEECQAWIHGAVYKEVYDEFKTFKYLQLPRLQKETTLSDEEIKVLSFVKENYLDVYSAKTLEKICHFEEPFQSARQGLKDYTRSTKTISKNIIAAYYKKISEEYKIRPNTTNNVNIYLNDLLFAKR